MKGVKFAVIAMAVLILFGFIGLFYTWNQKQGKKPPSTVATAPALDVSARALVTLPPGSEVISTSSSERFVDVLVQNPDGSRDVLQVRRADGVIAGMIQLRGQNR